MENQTKKLRLDEIKVESFVTESLQNLDTIKAGSFFSNCACTGSRTPCLCTHGCPEQPAPPSPEPPDQSGYNTTPCNCA